MIEKLECLEILDKMEFFGGQRAGRELWFDKQKEVQEVDLKNFNDDIQKVREYVSDTNVGKWIPVSERLPDKKGLYLVSHGENYSVCIEEFNGIRHFSTIHNYSQPKAWMPLPEPYKGEEE